VNLQFDNRKMMKFSQIII